MNIRIPDRLLSRLTENDSEYLKVMQLFQSIDELLQANLDFFPDYTKHGIPHVQKVLDMADHLIPDSTLQVLRAEDVCFLICGITIHDLGMFLSVDGVLDLIGTRRQKRKVGQLDKASWHDAWETYRSEVRRFSDERMQECFGEIVDVSTVCMDVREMKRRDYLVIGEFLRRSHPRLAHEIAVSGLPGSNTISILPDTLFSKRRRELIGLLARSHGLALRDTEDYLNDQLGDDRNPCGCPVFYLMAVLRIADLLDSGKHRAPKILQDRQAIYVPVSHQEWRWNQKVDMSDYYWDIEHGKLSIEGSPESSTEFVQLKKWLTLLQQELDMSWSVISEKYGAKYALSIHRIKSTILDPGSQTNRYDFLAKEAKLNANPEILKLMIDPLYGNDPSYGVRELLQNAVDACIEREAQERRDGNSYHGQVSIHVDSEQLVIRDNGIGMDEDVLLNYYLSAGASYRSSDSWKQNYTENGESSIARTGKFGVGFLAAFLLGDEIQVHTQHMSGNFYYRFSFDQESKPLDIECIERSEGPGTTITIHLKADVYQKLLDPYMYQPQSNVCWTDWYTYTDPAVEYYLNGKQITRRSHLVPRSLEGQREWLSLPAPDFHSLFWQPFADGYSSKLYCNGICIEEGILDSLRSYGLDVPFPLVLLTDRNNRLKVNLARSRVEQFPYKKELVEQALLYHIARLLATPWDTPEACAWNFRHPFEGEMPYLISAAGFCPINASIYQQLGEPPVFHLFYNGDDPLDALTAARDISSDGSAFIITPKESSNSVRFYEHNPQNNPSEFLAHFSYNHHLTTDTLNLYWKGFYFRETLIPDLSAAALRYIDYPQGAVENGVYQSEPSKAPFPFDPASFDFGRFPVVVQRGIQYLGWHDDPSEFYRLLYEVLGQPSEGMWIPFDMEARKQKFPDAFRKLKPYMDHFLEFGLKPVNHSASANIVDDDDWDSVPFHYKGNFPEAFQKLRPYMDHFPESGFKPVNHSASANIGDDDESDFDFFDDDFDYIEDDDFDYIEDDED